MTLPIPHNFPYNGPLKFYSRILHPTARPPLWIMKNRRIADELTAINLLETKYIPQPFEPPSRPISLRSGFCSILHYCIKRAKDFIYTFPLQIDGRFEIFVQCSLGTRRPDAR